MTYGCNDVISSLISSISKYNCKFGQIMQGFLNQGVNEDF